MRSNANFPTHASSAINVLLFFCEDLDSVTRMSAEENLNKIIRSLENGHVSRILLDLCIEIKKNGNQKSLRICLNLFSYYCPRLKEKNVKWYALKLLPILQIISQRKETLLLETLSEFIKSFSQNLQTCLSDNEVFKLIEVFLNQITSDCAVKRRCSSQNCVTLIQNCRNKGVMGKHALSKALDFIINDQQINTIIGVLGFLRLLIPILFIENFTDCKEIIEIYDLCLYLLENGNHSIINASLEVINTILCRDNKILNKLLTSNMLCHNEILKKRKSLKNQVFHITSSKSHRSHKSSKKTRTEEYTKDINDTSFKTESQKTSESAIEEGGFVFNYPINETPLEASEYSTKEIPFDESQKDELLLVSRLEEKSQSLSDFDNESFNSVDFESEIAIGERSQTTPKKSETVSLQSQKSTDSVGSFFNNLLSHTSAESMTKLFRSTTKTVTSLHENAFSSGLSDNPSETSSPKLTITKSKDAQKLLEEDMISLESIISLQSQASQQTTATQDTKDIENILHEGDETNILDDGKIVEDYENKIEDQIKVNERNKELIVDSSKDNCEPIKHDIGTINDQNMLHFTVRLISSSFLLTGVPGGLIEDSVVRVSIKNTSLTVIANCVKLRPDTLRLPFEIDRSEMQDKISSATSFDDENNSNSHDIENDFDMGDVSNGNSNDSLNDASTASIERKEQGGLEIKDDHFGESTTIFDFSSHMSKSSDEMFLRTISKDYQQKRRDLKIQQPKLNQQLEKLLSQSEIIERKPRIENFKTTTACAIGSNEEEDIDKDNQQFIYDVLLYHQHSDPILRGDVQAIVSNFIYASFTTGRMDHMDPRLGRPHLNDLLIIMMKGLRDDIHTVLIQALNGFDKVFPFLMKNLKKLQNTEECYSRDAIDSFCSDLRKHLNGEDEKLSHNLKDEGGAITPKDLLNRLQLCYDNKYWLVQNKYSDVIANLDYQMIEDYYSVNVSRMYENIFLQHLLQLVGDSDFRVREHVAESLRQYIVVRTKSNKFLPSRAMDVSLLDEYFQRTVFQDIPVKSLSGRIETPLVYLNAEGKMVLSKVLYNVTNMLLELDKQNMQLGVVNTIKLLIKTFTPIDYYDVWSEFKLVEICMKFTYQNYATAIDVGTQCSLVEIISNMMIANILQRKLNPKLFDAFFLHLIKILNIYYHLFTESKPLLMPNAQSKNEMFINSKELAVVKNFGYFGNDYFFIKLYTNLKSSYDSYKISINNESGIKLMSLLHISLNGIALLLEYKTNDNMLGAVRIIKELLQYINVLINYAPVEAITCLRFLLRYLLERNCACRSAEFIQFLNMYLPMIVPRSEKGSNVVKQNLPELFLGALKFPAGKWQREDDHAKHIKLFEPLVIYVLTLFMKSNAIIQAPILDLLSQLIEFNVTYSIMDPKHVIFDHVIKNVELIEAGIARNSTVIIRSIVKFFFCLTRQKDKLITIPKIISMINSLLANNVINKCSILALKELSYLLFFNVWDMNIKDKSVYLFKELTTQKEVTIGMLEKFLNNIECLKIFVLLQLDPNKENNSAFNDDSLVSIVVNALQDDIIYIKDFSDQFVFESFFKNCEKNVVLESKNYETLLGIFIKLKVNNFNTLSQANTILKNVVFETEEIFLINHLKLYLKNNSENLSVSEVSFFTKNLYDKIETCLITIMDYPYEENYNALVINYIATMQAIHRYPQLCNNFQISLLSVEFCEKHSLLLQSHQSLQIQMVELFCVVNYDKTVILQYLMDVPSKLDKKRIINKICNHFADLNRWTLGEIKQLLSKQVLPILIEDCPKLLVNLCQHEEYSYIVLDNLLNKYTFDTKATVISCLKLIAGFSVRNFAFTLRILFKMLSQYTRSKSVQYRIEELLRNQINAVTNLSKSELLDLCPSTDFVGMRNMFLTTDKIKLSRSTVDAFNQLSIILNDTKCEDFGNKHDGNMDNIKHPVTEDWLIMKIIQLSSDSCYNDCLVKILIDLKSESKLSSIMGADHFSRHPIIKSCIEKSFKFMINSFQNDCVQFNPHVNYMKMSPLLRVSLNFLMKDIEDVLESSNEQNFVALALSITCFMKSLDAFEEQCLVYVESKFIEKFVKEKIFKSELCYDLLIKFCLFCGNVMRSKNKFDLITKRILWNCIDASLKQRFIWIRLNSSDKYYKDMEKVFGVLYDELLLSIENTNFYEKYYLQIKNGSKTNVTGIAEDMDKEQKAVLVAKLIETRCDNIMKCTSEFYDTSLVKILKSVAISLLRTNGYFSYAATPFEVLQNYGNGKRTHTNCKFPSIPVEYLSDVDILQKFVKRLSIFGFATRQQFEEYFMTFLLLTNKVYDENMVDEQEQFQIKSLSLLAIQELLIMCKTFPVVGNQRSYFLHCPRWQRIVCNTLSLKKLYKIHLMVPGTNVFFEPNLENISFDNDEDNIVQTKYFKPNQYELSYIWQQMEGPSETDQGTTFYRNSVYFTDLSGIDLKSSCQLIFDIYCQLLEQNHSLVLPNLVKFCEICDNRIHIRKLHEILLKMQETVPIDDTISHQYIIYLLCKTQAILVPSYSELFHLSTLITVYLKSSHVFIRNAALHGLLCLLECCAKTNTTMGKLSDELLLLKEVITGYISRFDCVQESDIHTKLVWTLNFSLIEVTMKFDPECVLLTNTIISAGTILKRTTNETTYLCILHGLERTLISQNISKDDVEKIEKLVIDLVKIENEKFSIPALKLFISCVYIGSSKQIENTENSNGIVQDDPEIIVQQTEKVDILLHRIKCSTNSAAEVYGNVLCQIIRDLVPPNEILTKVIKELLTINQPHSTVIAQIVYQVFRSAIDSSFLQMLQDWLICSLPNFTSLIPIEKGVWCLTVIFISASINLHLLKLFPYVLKEFHIIDDMETTIFNTSARDFYLNLNADQRARFTAVFVESDLVVFKNMLKCL